jgi:hypothetical protein
VEEWVDTVLTSSYEGRCESADSAPAAVRFVCQESERQINLARRGETVLPAKACLRRKVSDNFGPRPSRPDALRCVVSSWNKGGRAVVRRVDPLPLTIIAATREVKVGDDDNELRTPGTPGSPDARGGVDGQRAAAVARLPSSSGACAALILRTARAGHGAFSRTSSSTALMAPTATRAVLSASGPSCCSRPHRGSATRR